MGILYIVATPIGNMKDITLRAIEVLQSVDGIACEDTRRSGQLLKQINTHINQQAPRQRLISYYEQNESRRIPEIIAALKNGLNIALVSDAGTPTISDPGFKLVRECVKEGIKVEAIPGASSVIAALALSGLPTDKFFFLGYLPKKPGKRVNFLKELQALLLNTDHLTPTVILFEAPHRLLDIFTAIHEVFGDIHLVVCRELTKIHEEIKREKVKELIAYFSKKEVRGELVILFNPKVAKTF